MGNQFVSREKRETGKVGSQTKHGEREKSHCVLPNRRNRGKGKVNFLFLFRRPQENLLLHRTFKRENV